MASSSERVLADMQRVIDELEGIVKGAAEATGDRAHGAVEGLKDRIEAARDQLSDVEQAARDNVRHGLRSANRYVRDNAWESLGAVAAVAFLAGLVLGRRN